MAIDWQTIAARWVLGDFHGEHVSAFAAQALGEGYDSPNLAVLAGESRPTIRDVRDTFEAALRDVGVDLPDYNSASHLILSQKLDTLAQQLDSAGYIAPWKAVQTSDEIVALRGAELLREVAAGHVLYGARMELVAVRPDVDDSLFQFMDGTGRVAEVHLTYSRSPEKVPWPSTEIYESMQSWRERFFPQAEQLARSLHELQYGPLNPDSLGP